MSSEVMPEHVEKTDTDVARVTVTTEDATGKTRKYSIGLAPTMMVDGAYVMSGRRVDDAVPDDNRVHGPSDAAWDAAASHFMEEGYEVFGR